MQDDSGVTVTIRRTLKKFDGEYAEGKEPVETTVAEEVVPFASLPSEIQAQLMKGQAHAAD